MSIAATDNPASFPSHTPLCYQHAAKPHIYVLICTSSHNVALPVSSIPVRLGAGGQRYAFQGCSVMILINVIL